MKNRQMIKTLTSLSAIAGIFLLSTTTTFAKEYYKWIDRNGSTHYSATPPPKSAKSRGKIDTHGYYSPTASTNNKTSAQSNTPAQTSAPTPPAAGSNIDQQQREANAALQNKPVEKVPVAQ